MGCSVHCDLPEGNIRTLKRGGKAGPKHCAIILACGEEPDKPEPPEKEGLGGSANYKRDNTASFSSPAKKRKVDKAERDEEDEQDGEHHDDKNSSSSSASKRRLACPFFKRRPSKTRPSCVYPGFSSIARLKEHLYRQHMLPPYRCPRCSTYFPTEVGLNEHSRAAEPCEVNGTPSLEGITPEQEKALKSKKRSIKSGSISNDEEKWRDIYGILFPHEKVPSPHCDTVSAPPQYEDSLRRELPSLVYDRLSCSPHKGLNTLDDETRNQIKALVSNCQEDLFSLWRQGAFSSPYSDTSLALVEGRPKETLTPSVSLDLSIDSVENAADRDARTKNAPASSPVLFSGSDDPN